MPKKPRSKGSSQPYPPSLRTDWAYVPEEMKKRIRAMVYATYQAIGADLQSARRECGEEGDMDRDEVVETVSDADRMEMYGRDREAYEFWDALPSYEQKDALVREAFPYETYE